MRTRILPQISVRGPVTSDGLHLEKGQANDILFHVDDRSQVLKDESIALHKAAAKAHCNELEARYGLKVKPYTDDEIERRALADEDGKDTRESGTYLYESRAEQLEARGLDPDKVETLERRSLEARGLDGGTDTALVGVDYSHEWFRELRLAGKLVPKFTRQMDIAEGYASYTGPVVGDALFLKQGALTSNAFTVNSAYNPTSTVITLAPQKIQAVIFVSGELTEDSLAPIIDNLRVSMIRGANVAIEHILLNGDVLTTTANINCYAATALGSYDARLCWDGLRAMDWKGTVGKSAGAFSGTNGANNYCTLDAVTDNLAALGKYGDDPSKVLTIMPVRCEKQILKDAKARPDTYLPLIEAEQGKLKTVSGSRIATVGNSSITNESSANVPTYDSFLSEGYPVNLATTGLYTGSGSSSGLVSVREDNIIWGWKRQFTFKVVDLPLGDQVAITATLRVVAKQIIVGQGVACAYNFKA